MHFPWMSRIDGFHCAISDSHINLLPGGGLDISRAAQHFILKYRNGELGRITLDQINGKDTSEPLLSSKSTKTVPGMVRC